MAGPSAFFITTNIYSMLLQCVHVFEFYIVVFCITLNLVISTPFTYTFTITVAHRS